VRAACRDFAARVSPRHRLADPLFGVAVLVMLAISGTLAMRNYSAPKQDLAGAVAAAEAARRPGERVYAVGYASEAFLGHFGARWGRIMTSGELARALAAPAPVMLVVGFPQRTLASLPELRRDLDAGQLRQVARLPGTLGDGAVLILQR
jgi:mannosyltransferase